MESVIYRELQIARAAKFLEVALPLFQELVNYGSNTLIRCASSSARGENEDLAILNLYRHVLEMTDAFEVLIASSCGAPTVPIVRSTFEALLGIEYILEIESLYVQRSLSWLAAHAHNRVVAYEQLIPDTDRGKEFQASLAKDKWVGDVQLPAGDRVNRAHERMESFLDREQFADIQAEYGKFKHRPKWYSLFDGPRSIQHLAYHLNHHVHYDFLYRHWSAFAHAQDFSHFLAVDQSGEGGIRGIRDASPLQEMSRFQASFMIEATRRVLAEFRPGEDFALYYKAEVQDRFLQVVKRDDFFQ